MQRTPRSLGIAAVAALAAGAAIGAGAAGGAGPAGAPAFSDPTTIDNPYLPLSLTRRCEYRGRADDGTRERSVRTVLEATRRFDVAGQAVQALIVRDDAYEDGERVESTRDYFAQADDGTVYYLGEHVDNLRRGRVVDHDGTWLYGRDTRVLGVAMPADPAVGAQYRFEDVPSITTESNRVEEAGLRVQAAGRLHTGVIRVQEFIQPEGEVEYKLYGPGIGLLVEYPPDARTALTGCR